MKTKPLLLFVVAISTVVVLGAAMPHLWRKSDVTAVVLVKPSIGGFAPVEGSPIGNTWSRDEVKPVVLVKPGIGGFVPMEGRSIGNTWSKDDVTAVVIVEPSTGGFVPFGVTLDMRNTNSSDFGTPAQPAIVESSVDGEFSGWEGNTIVKLANGQLWKQVEYYYEYHYAYMPKVLILKRGGGYQMKVDGIKKTVGVERLK